jgi:hypothetical protein
VSSNSIQLGVKRPIIIKKGSSQNRQQASSNQISLVKPIDSMNTIQNSSYQTVAHDKPRNISAQPLMSHNDLLKKKIEEIKQLCDPKLSQL